jgi:hypothetical protein
LTSQEAIKNIVSKNNRQTKLKYFGLRDNIFERILPVNPPTGLLIKGQIESYIYKICCFETSDDFVHMPHFTQRQNCNK